MTTMLGYNNHIPMKWLAVRGVPPDFGAGNHMRQTDLMAKLTEHGASHRRGGGRRC